MRHIIAALKVQVRKISTAVRVGLLLALPYGKDIHDAVSDQLPALQPYLPDNIYKFMGGAVVVGSILLSILRARNADKARHDA